MKIKHLLIFLLLAALCPWTAMAQKTHIANTSTSTQMTWAEFAQNVNNGYTYEGQTVYLDSDVTATTMAGTNETNCFKGTFEGQGHTLTFNYTASGSYYTAPFHYLNGATIQNLIVSGTITANYARCGGLAGNCYGTNAIINCLSNITINSTVNGDGTHGGFISRVYRGSTTFEGCTFAGSLLGGNTTANGGFVGWSEGNNNYASVSFSNCIYAPVANTTDPSAGATFARGRNNSTTGITISNCFYTSSEFQYTQGKQRYTITAESPVTVAMSGAATNYNLSHITAYSGNQGLVYNGTIVAGEGDQVRLNLSGGESYEANHGILTGNSNPRTLPMEAYNTVISDPSLKTTIGSGSETFRFLPFRSYRNYSVTQQIYTAEELGDCGYIQSIDFFKTDTVECIRNIDIYMIYTDLNDYGMQSNNWIPVSSLNLVFSGTVNFYNNVWTTITLDTPFAYDGVHNVAIVIDDNTGSMTSEEVYFLSFTTETNQGFYTFAYYDNFTPTGNIPNSSWGIDNKKNQIRVKKIEPTMLPYATDFETDCDWQLINGDRINQWCYGTAASNGEGSHSLYISNDGGVTNAYTDGATAYVNGQEYASSYTMVYAAKTFHFEAGIYNITFDWRALGNLDYDYMRVALVPITIGLEADAYQPAGFSYNTLPEGWIALDGGMKLSQSAEWQAKSTDFCVPAAGCYKVVFAWHNSTWNGNQPPAAIDNVSITAITCSIPFNLVATNINVTAADLNWNGSPDVDSYTLKYRTAEDIDAQFKEDFEDESSFANWQAFGSSNTGNNFGRRTAAARTGSYGFSFSSRFQAAQYSQYLISPELNATGDLEFYFRASENYSSESFKVGYSSTGNNVDDFVWGQSYGSSYNSFWSHFQETIPEGTKYIAIHYTAQYQYELYIDDITIGAYEVAAGEWQTMTVEGGSFDMSTTLTGLTPGTKYEAQVKCDESEWTEPVTFRTLPPFYATNFENGCDWTLVNGSLTNAWTWGEAAHNGEGTHGLYISNDGGTTNAYDNTASTMLYAYKTFNFEAGIYRFSYDWLANGENYYDYLRVALVPASVSLVPGDALPSGFSYNTLPGGWMALDGGTKLNQATEWQTKSKEILISDAGSYMMVFAWRNDYSYGNNPPAAIDNVSIIQVTCPMPFDLAADNITYTTAELNWNSLTDMDGYTVRYKATQYIVLSEDFENGLGDWTLRDCYYNTGVNYYHPHSGQNAFRFYYSTTHPQYLISPKLSGVVGGMRLKFYYSSYFNDNPEYFQIGFSSTDNATDSFTFGEEIIATDLLWFLYDKPIPAGTQYICWKTSDEDLEGLYIDDIVVSDGNPVGEWQTVTSTTTSVTLTGLTPGTRYEVQVKSDCDEGEWSEAIIFFTEPPLTKEIVGYGEGNANWYLIASPFAGINPDNIEGMTEGDYDLYRFNPSHEGEEWENYEGDNFSLINGQGYLYANSENVTLNFNGALATDTEPVVDTEPVEVPLTYDATDVHKCWNLLGNPFPCMASLNRDYYILNDEGTGINPVAVSSATPIPPCTAVFVKATSADDKVVFANFYEYVDLGLPSGTLWATCNVGANAPEEYGDYFAWGETMPKDVYDWNTYQYCMGSNNNLTKYCDNSSYGYEGFTDGLTALLSEDDAARANWGGDWRIPTKEEFEELYNNTITTWTQQNGVEGRLFTASNGNTLFLPGAGYRSGSSFNNAGSYGIYWMSSLSTDNPSRARSFFFGSGYHGMNVYERNLGHSVRPVRSARQH